MSSFITPYFGKCLTHAYVRYGCLYDQYALRNENIRNIGILKRYKGNSKKTDLKNALFQKLVTRHVKSNFH